MTVAVPVVASSGTDAATATTTTPAIAAHPPTSKNAATESAARCHPAAIVANAVKHA